MSTAIHNARKGDCIGVDDRHDQAARAEVVVVALTVVVKVNKDRRRLFVTRGCERLQAFCRRVPLFSIMHEHSSIMTIAPRPHWFYLKMALGGVAP